MELLLFSIPTNAYLSLISSQKRFSGASDEAISRTIDNALGLPRGTPAVIRDPEDGSALTISDSIPDGLTLDAKPAATADSTGGNGIGAAAAAAGGGGGGEASKWRESGNAAVSQDPLPRQRPEEVFYGSNENGKPINAGSGTNGSGGSGGGVGGGNSIGSSGSGGGGAKEFRGELLKF